MDKATKKRNQKMITWVSMALVVALLTAMPLLAKAEAEADGPVASILSGTVGKGDIHTVLHGGGTLSTKDTQDVTLAEGVKITEFLVRNGDIVDQGDPVAAVDKVSVMTAIGEVRDTMEQLQKKIESARNETVSASVTATAGGRVKQIFAQPGDSVQEVMLEHGALAVLSLDSLMAVDLESDLATGDSVMVTFEDGTAVTGRVESNVDRKTIVTIEDEGYAIGQAVTVTREDGTPVGAGLLYVHNAWTATAFTGTVSAVYAKEEREVYSGSTLFQLKDTDFTAQLEYCASQHREYEELLQELFAMYETGFVTAPCGGVVSGVETDSPFLLAASGDWTLMPLTASQNKGWKIQLLSAEIPPDPGPDDGQGGGDTGPVAGTQYIAIAAMVKEVGSNGLILKKSSVPGTASKTETVDEEGNTVVTWTYSEGLLDTAMMLTTEVLPVADPTIYTAGDLLVFLYDENYNPVDMHKAGNVPQEGSNQGGMNGMGGMGGMSGSFDFSSMFGGMAGAMSGSTSQAEEELFPLEGQVLLTVTPQDTATLSITLDEQEISAVQVGMEAQVRVEAIRDQVFAAEVVQVGTSGTNSGGNSKFTVKLQLAATADMLDGMSAAAVIPLYTTPEVLTIPVEALVEDGARTLVYTSRNKETGEPAAPVEVTTGVSDGKVVEILAGLKLGDTFYYRYYDILELDTSVNTQKYTFG